MKVREMPKITVRLNPELLRKLNAYCTDVDISVNKYMVRLIRRAMYGKNVPISEEERTFDEIKETFDS